MIYYIVRSPSEQWRLLTVPLMEQGLLKCSLGTISIGEVPKHSLEVGLLSLVTLRRLMLLLSDCGTQ